MWQKNQHWGELMTLKKGSRIVEFDGKKDKSGELGYQKPQEITGTTPPCQKKNKTILQPIFEIK